MKAKSIMMFVVLALFAMSVQSFAQMGDPAERMKRQMDELKTRLKLTEAQVPKVESIMKEQSAAMSKLFEDTNGDFGSMREKMTPLREKTDKAINALLTKVQKEEYKKLQAERAERMRNRGN